MVAVGEPFASWFEMIVGLVLSVVQNPWYNVRQRPGRKGR